MPRVELLREKLGIVCPREAVRFHTDLPVIVHTIRPGVFSAGLLNCRKSTAQTCVWEGTCKRGPLVAEDASGSAAGARRLSIVRYR